MFSAATRSPGQRVALLVRRMYKVIPDELLVSCLRVCEENGAVGLHFDDSGCVYYDAAKRLFQNDLGNLKSAQRFASNASSHGTLASVKKCYASERFNPYDIWLAQAPLPYTTYGAFLAARGASDGRQAIRVFACPPTLTPVFEGSR